MLESANLTYSLVEDTTAAGLILRVNTLLAAGWFLIGGICKSEGVYTQAMGIRGRDAVVIGEK